MFFSVIVPSYKCSKSLQELTERLNTSLSKITNDWEIIFINDASPENDWKVIQGLSENDKRVKGINLSRNFGQHYAITAGLDYCSGDWVVVMDGDLQDQPEEILNFYEKTKEGFDVVVGKRTNRQDSFLKKMSSKIFNIVFRYFSGAEISNKIGNFGIYSKRVTDSICAMRENNRSFGLFAIWTGFNRCEIDIKHSSREFGTSGYSLLKLLNLAFDSIIAHSNKLLKLNVKLGFFISFLSLVFSFWLIIRYYFFDVPILGWTSMMTSIYFLSGLLMSSIGIVGIYIGKIFDEVKKRPLYLVREFINFEKEK